MATQESNWELVGPLATIDSTTMTLPNKFDQGSEIDAAVAVAGEYPVCNVTLLD